MQQLTKYLSDSINRIFREAISASFTNAKESRFLLGAAAGQKKAAQKRIQAEREGDTIPTFLIASITTRCNLHCTGCYARANHFCSERAAACELSAGRWRELFLEAKDLGVAFILLAGGEPLARPDVLDEAAKIRGMIFPVFTNGTMLSGEILDKFDRCRNLVPVISIEGDRRQTDIRRGKGTFDLVTRLMKEMNCRGILYGASVMVTKENLNTVSSADFVAKLWQNGCRLILFVEYVPVDGNSYLAPEETERQFLAERQQKLQLRYPNMIFLSFPGDEKKLGGCLAAGRGFFHINACGGAEPCPASPYSDVSLKTGSIRQALKSALFRKIRESGIEADDHAGGCVLFNKKAEVENMLQDEENTM